MFPSAQCFIKKMNEKKYFILPSFNIVGWRFRIKGLDNTFKDVIGVYWFENMQWNVEVWPATTVPGTPWLWSPMNKTGAAVLVPGQYIDAYSLGQYKGYEALIQTGPVKVYRDNNRDSQADENPDTIETGFFGICIHKAGLLTKYINKNSAGCQVFKCSADFDEFIALCRGQKKFLGNKFTYTLLEF
jgi:hypothetical protein